jgi:hypothetical protein
LRDRSPRTRRRTPWRTRRQNHLRCAWAHARTASGRSSSTKSHPDARSARVRSTDRRCAPSSSRPGPSGRRRRPMAG